jgi:hypothetical protein
MGHDDLDFGIAKWFDSSTCWHLDRRLDVR